MSSADAHKDADTVRVESKEKGEMRLIARAAAILRALADRPTGASLGELAKATGLARSTVQRVVDALAVERLVSAAANASGIKLGVEIARLAAFVQSGPREQFRPYMDELMSRVQETVDLTILDDSGAVVVIDQLASTYSLRVVSHVGQRLPLIGSASGKAHLAQLDPGERRALVAPAVSRLTARTRTDVADILDDIESSAQRGYFLDEEEYSEGVCAVAISAPLPGAGNFAIAIPMPASRFASCREETVRHLLTVRSALVAANRRLALG